MKVRLLISLFLLINQVSNSQNAGITGSLGDLPSSIGPTPEASALIKGSNLNVGLHTGTANVSIPLMSLKIDDFQWPIALNYSTNGFRVTEIPSMVGLGWNLSGVGIITRTVMDLPDELRTPYYSNNYSQHNFITPNYQVIDYMDHGYADKQSDIFSFNIGGVSGKFILDENLQPKTLAQYNLKIEILNASIETGFKITTYNGTEYIFQEKEITISRNLTGTNCKPAENEVFAEVITAWYLSKITLPSRSRDIVFTYLSGTVSFLEPLQQSLSVNIDAENHSGMANGCPRGPACSIWSLRFSSCRRLQTVQSKYLKTIVVNTGDKIDFLYDQNGREDYNGGLRLSSIKMSNYLGHVISNVDFNTSYISAFNALALDPESKRLFLNAITITGSTSTNNESIQYKFDYNQRETLPRRNSFAQDKYGFYNGKNDNLSLLPRLSTSELNYTLFNNGTGYAAIIFGDRSIDHGFTQYGLLKKVTYPTGGYEEFSYVGNSINSFGQTVNVGGVAVESISRSTASNIVSEKIRYSYKNNSSNQSSSFLINPNLLFSDIKTTQSDGYVCGSDGESIVCVGPSCTRATIYSSPQMSIASSGGDIVLHRSVLEYPESGTNATNGMIEHKYLFYMDGALMPNQILGASINAIPSNVVPDILIGESETNYYAVSGNNSYSLQKSIFRNFDIKNSFQVKNYFVRKNYQAICSNRPMSPYNGEWESYDVMEGRIFGATFLLKSEQVRDYVSSTSFIEQTTQYEYASALHNKPYVISTTNSKGQNHRIERIYSSDVTSLGFMHNRYMLDALVEEKMIIDGLDKWTKKTNYSDWFSNGNVIVPNSVELRNPSNALLERINFKLYDEFGHVLNLAKDGNLDVHYIYGFKNALPIAKIQNANTSEISGVGLNTNILNNANSADEVSGEIAKLYDLLPNKLIETYTYEPLIGYLKQTDPNGRSTFYEYDPFNRLKLIKDQNGNIVKQFCYNYANQLVNCYTAEFKNTEQNGVFTRNNCPAGYTGSTVTYTVPANTVTSTISQADANAKAQQKVQNEGQAYANANGTCTPTPTCNEGVCIASGPEYRCVNGVCEVGFKVYTASVYVGGMYECYYRYEWSDGYWADGYMEISPAACTLSVIN